MSFRTIKEWVSTKISKLVSIVPKPENRFHHPCPDFFGCRPTGAPSMGNPGDNHPPNGAQSRASAGSSATSPATSPPASGSPPSYSSSTAPSAAPSPASPPTRSSSRQLPPTPPRLRPSTEVIPPLVQMQMRDTLTASDIRRTLRGVWPSKGASFFACFLCCVNFYTLSRFSLLAYFFKGPFLLQFLILSLGFGLPLLLLLMTLGQYLGSGYNDIWFISPAFKGIGAAFMFTYIIISVYSSLPISWLFVYFRDSFLASKDTPYRWAYCSLQFNTENCIKALNASSYEFVGWSVSSYFHGRVLDRHHLPLSGRHTGNGVKLDVAFNLALVWAIIFLALSRGLHGAGRILIVLGTLSLTLFLLVSFRFIEQFGSGVGTLLQATDKPFLVDGTSWLLAARETFLVWTAFGAVAMSVCSHNKSDHNLIKQLIGLFFLVMTILFISACFFASAMEAIKRKGLIFTPSSYESEGNTCFVKDIKLLASSAKLTDFDIISGSNLFLGENLISRKTLDRDSHYQVARFVTEIYPAALALEGPQKVSSFWSMSFYLSAILLNLGSEIVLMGTIVEAIVSINLKALRMWKSMVTFVCCAVAFLMSLPMATSAGIFIIYYLDFCLASLWWLSLLYLLLVIAVLIIRGRPCGTENLVAMLAKTEATRSWLLPTLTFHWNLIIPISIMILSIAFTRSYNPNGLTWTQVVAVYPHWAPWAQYFSIALQIFPLLLVFIFGAAQVTIYMMTSPGPVHERLQALFCPTISSAEFNRRYVTESGVINEGFADDPPPKYTPPPSYSTATARQIAKQIRNRLASSITIDLHYLSDANLSHGSAVISDSSRSEPSEPIKVISRKELDSETSQRKSSQDLCLTK